MHIQTVNCIQRDRIVCAVGLCSSSDQDCAVVVWSAFSKTQRNLQNHMEVAACRAALYAL